jgi:hypothetical protein
VPIKPRNRVLEAALNPVRPERLVQKEIIELLRLKHIPFWRIGQRDARGTQDPGVPDIVCFPERHRGLGLVATLWIEVKRSDGGRWAPAQRAFSAIVKAVGYPNYYLLAKDPQEVIDYLAWLQRGVS